MRRSSSLSNGNYLLSTDGSGTGPATDPSPGAIGVVLRNPRGAVIETISKTIGPATNTTAEYTALIEGLELALDQGIRRIRIFVDSELIVDQLEGKAAVRAEHIKGHYERALSLLGGFLNWRLSWVPRTWNSEADLLARAALTGAWNASGVEDELRPSEPLPSDTAPAINVEGQVAWISEQTDLPQYPVERVLDLEFEFLVGVGIVDLPDYSFRYYSTEELEGLPQIVDTQRLAQDAERILNIPSEVAAQILDAEYQFLRMRGLAE